MAKPHLKLDPKTIELRQKPSKRFNNKFVKFIEKTSLYKEIIGYLEPAWDFTPASITETPKERRTRKDIFRNPYTVSNTEQALRTFIDKGISFSKNLAKDYSKQIIKGLKNTLKPYKSYTFYTLRDIYDSLKFLFIPLITQTIGLGYLLTAGVINSALPLILIPRAFANKFKQYASKPAQKNLLAFAGIIAGLIPAGIFAIIAAAATASFMTIRLFSLASITALAAINLATMPLRVFSRLIATAVKGRKTFLETIQRKDLIWAKHYVNKPLTDRNFRIRVFKIIHHMHALSKKMESRGVPFGKAKDGISYKQVQDTFSKTFKPKMENLDREHNLVNRYETADEENETDLVKVYGEKSNRGPFRTELWCPNESGYKYGFSLINSHSFFNQKGIKEYLALFENNDETATTSANP